MPRRPSLSSHHCAFHCLSSSLCSQSIAVELAPSLTAEEPSRHPSPPRSRRAIPRRRGAIMLSMAIKELSRRPLPLRSSCAIYCRRGAVTPSLAVTEPSAVLTGCPHSGESRHQHSSLATPLPGLLYGWLSHCLSSRCRLPSAGASHCNIPFHASRPTSWLSHILDSHAATSHLLVPLPSRASRPAG